MRMKIYSLFIQPYSLFCSHNSHCCLPDCNYYITCHNSSICFIIGLVLSSILMGVVSSAVNTVIICFAENPLDFQTCHPDLCEELNSAWVSVWPGCLTVTGTKMINNSNINIDMLG
jgi:hypothetical protein